MKTKILSILTLVFALTSCDDVFTPAPENFKDLEQMYRDAAYAQGFLVNAYRNLPGYFSNNDYATDDAVTNNISDNWRKMATGTWTASNNPIDFWSVGLGTIQNLNLFLENADKVKWADDPEPAAVFNLRMKGEAYGLRGAFMYYLLRSHAGFTDDGQLLGVPIFDHFLTSQDNFNLPRAAFEECVQQIYNDLDSANYYLPLDYENIQDDSQIPVNIQKYTKHFEVYNRVMGQFARQLFSGQAANAFRARTMLLAASPAFQHASNTTTWEQAADANAQVLDHIGGLGGLAANGDSIFINGSEIDVLKEGINPKEILWRENLSTNSSGQETDHFPPSLFGNGRMNPSENLVKAFPMANGYPINDVANSGFDPANPYQNRDPRLSLFIIYNGSPEGVTSTPIYTGSGSTTNDAINKQNISTRTGYYMKKRLRMDVNRNPTSIVQKTHYTPRMRYTEFFLNYAEAANEAWGPTGKGKHSYSAKDVIKAIRQRAKVGGADDPYLEECATDKNKMRELIRNERRIELCFESFRFWDLHRWKANLNETVMGYDVSQQQEIEVEARTFEDYMYYGPIPFGEILKYNNLQQNKGWK